MKSTEIREALESHVARAKFFTQNVDAFVPGSGIAPSQAEVNFAVQAFHAEMLGEVALQLALMNEAVKAPDQVVLKVSQ